MSNAAQEQVRYTGDFVFTRWVWQGQPVDPLVLQRPRHDGSPKAVAREIYHRLLCRLAAGRVYWRQLKTAWLGAAIGIVAIALPGLPAMAGSILGGLLFIAVMVLGIRWLPSKLMAGVIRPVDQAEAAGVVRRALLRDLPADVAPDLADVWRHGWLTSESRPIAAELPEADARHAQAELTALLWLPALLALACGIAALPGGLFGLVLFSPLSLGIAVMFLILAPNPMLQRHVELEAQEAVEGVAFIAAGGQAWGQRSEEARKRQIKEAHRDRAAPIAVLGTSTGLLAARGDDFAPSAGLEFALSLRDLQQHLVVFGGTGAGKTSGILRPLAAQAAVWPRVGLVVMDGKGALPGEVGAGEIGPGKSGAGLTVIDPATSRISLVAGLEPAIVIDTLVSILGGGGSGVDGGSFFRESAAGLLRRAAVIAHVIGEERWTLNGIAAIAFQHKERDAALLEIESLTAEQASDPVLVEATNYFTKEWPTIDDKTRSNIEATARAWITTITAHGDLLSWADTRDIEETDDIMTPLTGGRIGLLLPAHRYGRAGAVVTALLKARIYRGLKARAESPDWAEDGTSTPVLILMDEAQEIATSEDATMLAIGRSLGLAVVAATQTVEGVIERLGAPVANKWLAIFGSAMTLSGRSVATDAYMAARAGASWRLSIDKLEGLPVRTAIGADSMTGVIAAGRHQPTIAETEHLMGSSLIEMAWSRATQPIAKILNQIGTGAGGSKTSVQLEPRPVINAAELQTLLAEPDTALILATRARVARRDVIRLSPAYPGKNSPGSKQAKDG